MQNKIIKCNKINISNSKQFTLIAGPCQLENEKHAFDVANKRKEITKKLNHVLEEMITKNPNQWIWTHNRWKL